MKKIDMVLSTRNRWDKLIRMIESLPDMRNLNLHVVFDGDMRGFERFSKLPKNFFQGGLMTGYLIEEHSGSVYCRNYVFPLCEDGVLIACDDITFDKGSVESAPESFNTEFPSDFGVVGFNQYNAIPPNNFCWTGVCLIGQGFLDSYEGKILLNPEYFHFATREIEWKALKLKALFCDTKAKIFHYHPDRFKEERDRTHKEARIFKRVDMRIKALRESQGEIWGIIKSGI